VFPYAERVPASLPGKDVLHTPGWALEVKARRGLDLPGWLKQAHARAVLEGEVPVLVVRPDGFGPERIGQWAAVVTLETLVELMKVRERDGQHEGGLGGLADLAGDGGGGVPPLPHD
jgi:hypothetical protein